MRSRGFKEIICVAHYAKGYDSHFIIKAMVGKMNWQPKIISKGAKLISVEYEGVKFIDSLNFLPMPLSKLPQTLGLDSSLAKGYFPHLFNKNANSRYEGSMPPPADYGVEQMTRKDAENFLSWHREMTEKNYVFKMDEEIVKYCVQDVNILRIACTKFRQDFLSLNETDPFREALTIASACMCVFKKKYLKANEIAIIPPRGYRWADVQSQKAIKWLLSEERSRGQVIQHAANGKEVRREGKKVDGYLQTPDSKIIFEFNGCFYHGCPNCFPNRHESIHKNSQETMQSRFETTERKLDFFTQRGYRVIQKWECEFDREVERDSELHEYLREHPLCEKSPLNPRDAFYGGRTNAIKLYHRANESEGEEIKYIDICSLYPYVNKYKAYPLGHPVIYVGEDCPPLEEIEGLVRCDVLPPTDLYLPVLPMKANGKLFFPLCRKCALVENQGACCHTQEERKLVGTWVTNEVKKAMSLGYKVLKIHEAWHYDDITEYSRETREGGLFSGYINNFLKVKQEASGWPSWCNSEDEKERYLKLFLEREGVCLEKKNVEFNAGKRYLAKLMLNSFWGKFGQRENQAQTSVVKELDELYTMLSSPTVEVHRTVEINDEMLYVHWEEAADAVSATPSGNIVLACYTTAHARLELYKYLEHLNRRTIYHDTDSCIYTQKPGEWTPPIGDY
ncbi:uncharacterized protein LOC124157026 [Ischnura elegans]|uniref:uncharacterized protein LOC124157026 n=1 Tax=Ischnura elegans TaxID=197161 RepID=UPI001ED8A4BA|nr:uncharacterized protein LOC124157026 [Ischnura elegans]